MENRLPRFGECEGTYLTLQPADHTGVCWAGALGGASRGQQTHDPAEVIARRALAMLADGTVDCICAGSRASRRRPRM